MSTKKREVIWGGGIIGADMRAQTAAKTLRRPPVPLIEPRQKHGRSAWKAVAARPSHPQRPANA
jgi:hypothetical protein